MQEDQPHSFSFKYRQDHNLLKGENSSQIRVTICLAVIGFYFLVFSVIQLLSNLNNASTYVSLNCQGNKCFSYNNSLPFASRSSIYIYLYHPYLSQADIDFQQLSNTQLTEYRTNADLNKNLSISGEYLEPNKQAYPNGKFPSLYPSQNFQIIQESTQEQLVIDQSNLTVFNQKFQNSRNLSEQWANLESERYTAWNEKQISLGLMKLWGKVNFQLNGEFTIIIESKNQLSKQLGDGIHVVLTNNKAMNGQNVPLCIFNLIFGIVLFIFGFLSFIYGFGQEIKGVSNSWNLQALEVMEIL